MVKLEKNSAILLIVVFAIVLIGCNDELTEPQLKFDQDSTTDRFDKNRLIDSKPDEIVKLFGQPTAINSDSPYEIWNYLDVNLPKELDSSGVKNSRKISFSLVFLEGKVIEIFFAESLDSRDF